MEKILFSEKLDVLLKNLDYSRLGKKVAIKVHFGEKNCNTYVDPKLVEAVYNKVVSLKKKAALVECNVLYKGSRTFRDEHIKTAKEHGFDFAPIDILDGDHGENSIDVKTKHTVAKIGGGLKEYDSMIVISHFKGHMMAGFGAAIKNVGMGLGSRGGKMHMHCTIKPSVNPLKCTSCGVCIKNCPVDAISFGKITGKAKIDHDKCIGCATCIAVCNFSAVMIPWISSTNKGLQKRVSEYCEAVFEVIPRDKIIYINVLEKITKECDCMGISQVPMMDDVGFIAGYDIVATDKASLDLANEKSGNKFDKVNFVGKEYQIEVAEEVGIGSSKYKLEKLD